MDCKSFIRKHAAYIDDILPGVEMTAMRVHLVACRRCAKRDQDVRRALLLVRNLPPIEVSSDFQERLRARLADEGPVPIPAPNVVRRPMAWMAVAAAAVFVTGVAVRVGVPGRDDGPARLPAVIATGPRTALPADDSTPAYLASMSTGIPMWPALMLAEEGPLRFATTELQTAGWESARPH